MDKTNISTAPSNTVSFVDPLSVYKKMYGATSVTSDSTYVTIVSDGIPKSKSAYYAITNALYEAFSGITFGGYTFRKNPNSIQASTLTIKIPLNPQKANTHQATAL
jgi:hypothetical protein